MTAQEYRKLRNNLQLIICYVDINTIEYKNLNKRIQIIENKLRRIL